MGLFWKLLYPLIDDMSAIGKTQSFGFWICLCHLSVLVWLCNLDSQFCIWGEMLKRLVPILCTQHAVPWSWAVVSKVLFVITRSSKKEKLPKWETHGFFRTAQKVKYIAVLWKITGSYFLCILLKCNWWWSQEVATVAVRGRWLSSSTWAILSL